MCESSDNPPDILYTIDMKTDIIDEKTCDSIASENITSKTLTIDEKIKLIRSISDEIITEDELRTLLENATGITGTANDIGNTDNGNASTNDVAGITHTDNTRVNKSQPQLIAYDGFEPSGQLHIAQGILRVININKMIQAGFTFKILIADWYALLNNKLDGNFSHIQTTGKYFIEVWKAAGIDQENVEFVWASDLVKKEGYWDTVMNIASRTTLNRILRTTQIMGRSEKDKLNASQIMYPLMQATDIFMLGARVTQLGLDQRKVNMLVRQVGEELGFWKPVVSSAHMLLGLDAPTSDSTDARERAIANKMSKSKPDSAIFMTDTTGDVQRKINKAWCPEGVTDNNPILEYCTYILFEKFGTLRIERAEQFGGSIEYKCYEDLERDFLEKKLHPMDLKKAVAQYIDKLLIPVREHFKNDATAHELLEKVKSFSITR